MRDAVRADGHAGVVADDRTRGELYGGGRRLFGETCRSGPCSPGICGFHMSKVEVERLREFPLQYDTVALPAFAAIHG